MASLEGVSLIQLNPVRFFFCLMEFKVLVAFSNPLMEKVIPVKGENRFKINFKLTSPLSGFIES